MASGMLERMSSRRTGRVDWLEAAKSACLWTGACLLAAALITAIPEYLFSRAHEHALATVTEVETQADAAGNLSYIPHFRFRLPSGEVAQVNGRRTHSENDFKPRQTVPVMYPQGHPDAAVLATIPRVYPWGVKLGMSGIVIFDIGCVLWVARRKRESRLRQALRNLRASEH